MKSDAAFHLGIDQGTQSSRAIIFDQDGSIITQAQIKVGIQILPNNFVEQDGNEILQSVEDCLSSLFKEIDPENICSAGLATQRSSVIAWDKTTGTAVSPLISWRDRRATEFIATLEKQENEIQKISGLRLTPYYGASKIRWLLRHHTQTQQLAEQQRLAIGPLASFLIYRLCRNQPYLIDHANALRLQLLNNDKLAWDDQLCQWFEIPAKLLPQTVATNYGFGELCQTNIRLNAVNGDQTAAMYSLGQMQAGECLVNLGTGGFVLCPVEQQTQIPHGLLGGLSMSQENQVHRLIEGTINGCGAALNWYKKFIHFEGEFDLDHCINVFQGKLIFQNGVNGLGSPLWQDVPNQFLDAGTLSQIDNPEQDQAVAAIVESILFLVRLIAMRCASVWPIFAGYRLCGRKLRKRQPGESRGYLAAP